jgi:hypothetical protein
MKRVVALLIGLMILFAAAPIFACDSPPGQGGHGWNIGHGVHNGQGWHGGQAGGWSHGNGKGGGSNAGNPPSPPERGKGGDMKNTGGK